ncbi:hypothetical protein [Halpernia sp.]|uniref:hypothetical protein n=1 Tax=Halpernia sp. TaxID=2782209 RepID=UPI003A950911
MIKILKYKEIDFNKYNKCLENSCQNSDYAERQFLDIVSNKQWFLLVYNDYEAIMPVSFVRKLGFTFILMPKICQQLGVFSEIDNPEINSLFYHYLQNNFLVLIYSFNKNNQFNQPVETKTSYFLEKNLYQNIKKKYSVHRRRNVRIIGDLDGNISILKNKRNEIKSFFLNNILGAKNQKIKEDYYKIIQKLLNSKIGQCRILNFKEKTQSLVYLYEGKKTYYLSLFINAQLLSNKNLPSIMIDNCLQEFIKDKNFDFVGSDIENVAKFNDRFGAISYKYAILKNSKRSLLKILLKNFRIITKFAPSIFI